jgi:hypothetical protein
MSTASIVSAQTAVTSYFISNVVPATNNNVSDGWTAASAPYSSATTYTNHYGQTSSGAGVERRVDGFAISALSYFKIPSSAGKSFDKVLIQRDPSVPGTVVNTLYENTASVGNNNYLAAGYLGGLDEVINSFVCNRGSDNTFANVGSTTSNIERIDLIKTGGVVCTNPARQGFLINERNGNDPFKVAAITALNGAQEVNGLGTLLSVPATAWGRVGPSIISVVMSREVGVDPFLRAKQDIAAQTISGVYISLADLGISAGTTIYGMAVFPNDVTSAMDLVGLSNIPGNTPETAGGIDMMAGGGYFVESSILPVRFINFSAAGNGKINNLQWTVSNEQNINRYEVERSIDNTNNFTSVGTVAPQVSSSQHTYTYADNIAAVTAAVIYYRIKQIDNDGQFTYSTTVSVRPKDKSATISFFPNPVYNKMSVRVPLTHAGEVTAQIVTTGGKTVHTQKQQLSVDAAVIVINNLSRFAEGMYILRISTDDKTYSEKFLLKK